MYTALLFIALFLAASVESQVRYYSPDVLPAAQDPDSVQTVSILPDLVRYHIPAQPPTLMRTSTQPMPKVQPLHFGFFCRVESSIAKKSVLAPKFRLGSVEYVDRLEGKEYYPRRPRTTDTEKRKGND